MINILTFNEWKESDGYKIQQWFINKKISIEKWFEDESFAELEFDYFEFDNDNNIYDLYSGELYFNEDTIQWMLSILINPEKMGEDNTIEQVKLVLKGSDKESHKALGTIERDVDEPEISLDLLIELINEFKTEHLSEE